MIFIPFNPHEAFPKGTYERFLVGTLNKMNINEFYDKEDKGGESPYNPLSMLGIIFYAFSLSVFHSRKISKYCRVHTGFMYVSGYCTPDHSTISRFIRKHEKGIIKIFTEILYIADNQGYIDYRQISTDGTKIRANASKRFTGTIEDFKKKKDKLEKKIELAIKKQEEADKIDDKNYWEKKEEAYKENHEKIKNFLKNATKIFSEKGKEIRQNITDTDTKLMKMKSGFYANAYNAQIGVCGKNGIIAAAAVSNEENDKGLFKIMVKNVKEMAPENKKEECKDSKYINDNGYYSAENMEYASENNLDVYIPDSSDKNMYRENKQEKKGKIGIDECQIMVEGDDIYIICPGGKTFRKYTITKKRRGNKIYYRFLGGTKDECKGCRYYEKCISHLKANRKRFEILEKKVKNWNFIKENQLKLCSEEGRKIYSTRMPIVEKVFGHMKENWGFNKFLNRGLKYVSNYWMFVCSAYNLKKIFNLKYAVKS